MIALVVFDALKILLSSFDGSVIKKTKVLPEKRTPTQLKKMLKGELIDLVIAYQ
tara:strand:+ start:324 stop:485 length:162 start_codon:yes stop_codon:yes gene_type:complete